MTLPKNKIIFSNFFEASFSFEINIIWTFMIIANTLISHSDLFYFYHYDNHNDHHKHFNCNYGISCGMDKIFKTEKLLFNHFIQYLY